MDEHDTIPISPSSPLPATTGNGSAGGGGNGFGHSGREVFEILAREHADMLTAYLRSLIGADPSVDDLFQQAMLVAWRRLGDYDRSRPFGPWLRGIAQRLVMEHYRKGKVRPATTDPTVLAELDVRFDQVNRAPGDTFRQRAERLTECMKKLPDAMRQALDLVYARHADHRRGTVDGRE
ncbi:MAG: sigma factor [Phycisphaerales bacterium]